MKVSKSIRNLVPYTPGKPIEETQREWGLTDVVKLASNENPLGPSPKVLEAIEKASQNLHRYPDASCHHLAKKLSECLDVPVDHLVFGNGSNELIDLMIRVFCEPGERVLMSQKSFIAYKICAQAARCEIHEFPMGEDFKINIPHLMEHFQSSSQEKDRILFVANPNNPTGSYASREEIEKLCEVSAQWENFILVLDEAYNEFVRAEDYPESIDLVKRFPHVVSLRTMGKVYGLAGIRIGYMVAHPEICNYVHRVRNPFNVNSLAQAAALAALTDQEYLKKSQETNWRGLDYFYEKFSEWGLSYVESQANFVLFDTQREGRQVSQALLQRGVIVRPMEPYGLHRHIRLSVGLQRENEKAMRELKEVLSNISEVSL